MNPSDTVYRSDTQSFLPKVKILFGPKISTDSTPDLISLRPLPGPAKQNFFTSQQMRPDGFHPLTAEKYQPDWILGLLLLGFILLAWTHLLYRRRLQQMIRAPFSRRFYNQLIREGDLLSERMTPPLGFLYLMTTSLLAYQCYIMMIKGNPGNFPTGLLVYGIIASVLVGLWLVKILLARFLSYIFRTKETTGEYILNYFIFNFITGIILLPFLVLAVYMKSQVVLWGSIFIFLLIFFFRIGRGLMIGITMQKFSYLFLFVYLCTLEFLPLVILLKLLIRHWF